MQHNAMQPQRRTYILGRSTLFFSDNLFKCIQNHIVEKSKRRKKYTGKIYDCTNKGKQKLSSTTARR